MKVGGIVLAAGGSSRLGCPKQLVSYGGRSLLRRAAETALASVCDRVVVVIGNEAPRMRGELDGLPISIVENRDWQTGLSSSIRAGLEDLATFDPDGVMITLCDQPFVTSEILDNLIAAHCETSKPIIASAYETTWGVPAFFSRTLFPELTSLTADQGARRLILKHSELVATINFPQGSFDIDTPQDLKHLT